MESALLDKVIDTAKNVCVKNIDCFAPFKLDTYCCILQCCNIFEYINKRGNPFISNDQEFEPSLIPYIGLLLIPGAIIFMTVFCCCLKKCCEMCYRRKQKQYVIFRDESKVFS